MAVSSADHPAGPFDSAHGRLRQASAVVLDVPSRYACAAVFDAFLVRPALDGGVEKRSDHV